MKAHQLIYIFAVIIIMTLCMGCKNTSRGHTTPKDAMQMLSDEELAEVGIQVGVTKQPRGSSPPKPGLFRGIAVSDSGKIFVLPQDEFRKIWVYDLDGNYLYSFGVDGGAGGTFWIECDGDDIITYWSRNNVVLCFDQDGKIQYAGLFDDGLRPYLDELDSNSRNSSFGDGIRIFADSDNWLMSISTVRSQIIRADDKGNETVIYQAKGNPDIYLFILFPVTYLVIWSVKKYGKKRHRDSRTK